MLLYEGEHTQSNPWYMNNPASKSNGITADTGLNFPDRFNSTAKTKTRQQKSRGFDDRSKTQWDGNLVGPFVLDAGSLSWCWETGQGGVKALCFFWLSPFWVEPFADPINGKSKNHFFYGTNLWRFCQNKKREFTQCNFALVKFVLSVISHKALPTQMTVWMRGLFTPPRLCLRLI